MARRVAFTDCEAVGDDEQGDIAVANADGSGSTKLTNTSTSESGPAWSPDGTKIAFSFTNGFPFGTCGNGSLYTMNPDGTGAAPLLNDDTISGPDWQPLPGPQRSEFKNAAQFCKAEREFLGESAFAHKDGASGHSANGFGKCVSADGR
jgi:dipeptidyl aminopeptidase/acylaminoacyl peptidase